MVKIDSENKRGLNVTPPSISIIGTGYVGLCTAVVFASKGYNVITSEQDHKKAASINEGIPPFFEPGLEELLQRVLKDNNLKCVLTSEEAILNTDVTFITVGTPNKPDGSIDLQYIERSAQEIGEALKKKETYHLLAVKSTVVPGTTANIVKSTIEKYSGKRCGINFGLCVNPEFLREGNALYDTLHPDRIIIGEHDKKSGDFFEAIYNSFYGADMPSLIRTTLPAAELIKYANNIYLATKISFINQVANICEKIPGADVTVIAKAIGLDKRIGPLFLNAGLGYGGSCLPKDVKAIINFSKSLGYNPIIFNAVEEVNKAQPIITIELCKTILKNLPGKQIAILGLAFKPNTDDMREAISIKIVNNLLNEGAKIVAYDPAAMDNAREVFGNDIQYANSAIQCLKNADCCILTTEWGEFRQLTPEDFIQHMKNPTIIDGRRIYDPKQFSQKLKFKAIGLGTLTRTL